MPRKLMPTTTKLAESVRKMIEQKGSCEGILCEECPGVKIDEPFNLCMWEYPQTMKLELAEDWLVENVEMEGG